MHVGFAKHDSARRQQSLENDRVIGGPLPNRLVPAASTLSSWGQKIPRPTFTRIAFYTTKDAFAPGEGRWRASKTGALLSGWTCLDLLGLGPEVRGALAVSLDDARVKLCHCSPST
ncbi:hypothetical protein PPGU19_082460 (plasmid) [Paraburkholderia sp. PGU19]|nr:hypothetical protein PPGU19_082460 [Paraburkholderia sp. PGU19]